MSNYDLNACMAPAAAPNVTTMMANIATISGTVESGLKAKVSITPSPINPANSEPTPATILFIFIESLYGG